MSNWPQWDVKVQWPSAFGYAIDDATGREAYYGPEGEPGTPDQGAADNAWGDGNYSGWPQPDGRFVFYQSLYGFNESLLAWLGGGLEYFTDQALSMWAQSEGMPAHSYNPLATMRTGYGEHYESPYTAPFYPHPYAGLRATVDTLKQNAYGYPAIVQALVEHLGLSGIFDAINSSQWCGGCQGGHYPNVLYNAIKSGTGAPPAGNTGGQPSPTPVGEAAPPADIAAAWDQVTHVVNNTLPTGAYYLGILNATKL